jgi:hypothetical protein
MALMAELVFFAEIEFSDPSIATGQQILKLIRGVHRLGTRQVGLVAGPFRPPFGQSAASPCRKCIAASAPPYRHR